MSELKVDKVSPRTGNYVALNTVGSKNILINGDMSIAQRGTSTASVTSSGYYACDRWRVGFDTAGTWTISQDTDVPTGQGFAKSMKFDCTTANASLSAASGFFLSQRLEGQNLQYLKKGTSSAESLTASFWVKSNKTGTYILMLDDIDNSRSFSQSYTISSANTWEKKTLTFAGDTTGTLDNDNARSFDIRWWFVAGTTYTSGTLNTSWNSNINANLAVGQVNLADNTANEFYITGVQLEAGTTASDFEFLPYDVNLDRCERYYQIVEEGTGRVIATGAAYSTSDAYGAYNYRKQMRATPSFEQTTGTGYYRFRNVASDEEVSSLSFAQISNKNCRVNAGGSMTAGDAGWFSLNNPNSKISMDAEL